MPIVESSVPLALPGGDAEVSKRPNPPNEPLIDRALAFSAAGKGNKKPAFHKGKKAF
ncbi:MAG: hypothetical protein WDN46_10300 [Methylocella sp.]